ncbi:sensor histidine kinase [Streptomyces sp. WAC07149]|uniref:anti-sigma factor RsbA family regulatory protein n=1 Tax=Streptomyces sp. WAC07149 TaxID=2487425 RepID=UPI000F791AD5|nr:anti-sigma factor RsbA family regulatory protein [Streptomyces sp. WAC07149]RST04279.1 sensor histidine kinase [Streptomyces sp. WAC07149]
MVPARTCRAGDRGTTTDPAAGGPGGFVHPALLYRGPEEYLTGVGDFVRAALAADEPVLVAVPGPRLGPLREVLGSGGAGVEFTDMARLGRNPGRILAALREFAERHEGRAARIVGEPVWAGRTPAEVREAVRHEALVNTAFAGRDATVLCAYEVAALSPGVLADARRTHPALIEGGRVRPSPGYTDPSVVGGDCDTPLPEPGPGAVGLDYARGDLARVREFAGAWAGASSLAAGRRGDLLLAVAEAAANSLAHGGGRGTLRLWRAPGGGGVVAEIRDGGRLADPLAGRRRPPLASTDGGRGLWMIHQLCDLVEVRSTSSGLTVRLHMADV